MRKPLFLFIFLCCIVSIAYTQNNEALLPKEHYLGIGANLSLAAVNDKLNTNMPYFGLNMGTAFDFTTTFKHSYLQVHNVLASGGLLPYGVKSAKSNRVDAIYENFGIANYYKLKHWENPKIYMLAGPALTLKGGARINNGEVGNSALTYNGAASLAFAAKASKYFSVFPLEAGELNDFKLEASLTMPLISMVIVPTYTGLSETVVTDRPSVIDFSSVYLGYFSNFFNIETGISATYYLKNRNAIELSYTCDFTSTNPQYHPSKTLNQFFCVKLLYNLK